jgi:CubicO group peptidase (beta-lactamase class C family)
MNLKRRRFLAAGLGAMSGALATPAIAQRWRRAADTVIVHPTVTRKQNVLFDEAAAEMRQTSGEQLLIMQGGTVLYEAAIAGVTLGSAHMLASGTKSFSGALAVAAAMDGLLTFDEKLSQTLREWRDTPALADLTLRQLLTLTSGIDPGEIAAAPAYAAAVRDASILSPPNDAFHYGPNPFQIFGEMLQRKLSAASGETVSRYLARRLLQPVGLQVAAWTGWLTGEPRLPHGAYLTPREWAKFGALVAFGGVWNGQTVLDRDLLQECFIGTPANPAYGMTWWLNLPFSADIAEDIPVLASNFANGQAAPSAPRDLVIAAGAGKQRLYVVPSLGLVVVRFGSHDPRFDDEALLSPILAASR